MGISPGLQTPAPAPVEPHQERNWAFNISGQKPAFAWALAAFLGGAVISAAPRDTVVRLLLPVAVMFTYVGIAYPRDSGPEAGLRSARIAQLADSAYFLGFLWTLWALIDSFVLKRATGAETAFRVFGYALVTTAAGMATRLYLLQFKYGAEDQAAEAEFTVERNLQAFSTAMQDASRSIQSFHTDVAALNQNVEQLSGTLETLDRRFVETHQETAKAVKDNITAVVEEIRASLKTPVQEYGRAIRAFTAGVDQQSLLLIKTLEKSSADVGQAITDATEKAHKIIQETGERVAAEHISLAGRLRTQTEQIVGELRALAERMASLDLPAEGLKGFVQCFTELERALVALTGILGPEGEVRHSLSAVAEEVRVQTDAVSKTLADVVARLHSIEIPSEIAINVGDVTRSIESLQKAMEDLLRKATDQRWERAPQTASEAILKLSTSVNTLRQTLDSADASAKKIPLNGGKRKKRFWRWNRT